MRLTSITLALLFYFAQVFDYYRTAGSNASFVVCSVVNLKPDISTHRTTPHRKKVFKNKDDLMAHSKQYYYIIDISKVISLTLEASAWYHGIQTTTVKNDCFIQVLNCRVENNSTRQNDAYYIKIH